MTGRWGQANVTKPSFGIESQLLTVGRWRSLWVEQWEWEWGAPWSIEPLKLPGQVQA